MSVYEIFITGCKIAGFIVMLPVVMGLFLALACWVCHLLCYFVSISIWIADKLIPSKREECIYRERTYSCREPEQPPPVYSNKNLSKEMEECRISPKEDG